jgi:hypothetical protein
VRWFFAFVSVCFGLLRFVSLRFALSDGVASPRPRREKSTREHRKKRDGTESEVRGLGLGLAFFFSYCCCLLLLFFLWLR